MSFNFLKRVVLYIVPLIISFYNPYISIFLLIYATLMDRNMILAFIFILPLIETAKPPAFGITVSKVYSIFLMLYLYLYIVKRRYNILATKISRHILLLIFWVTIGFIIAYLKRDEFYRITEIQYNSFGLINENLSFIGQLILCLLLITFLHFLEKEKISILLSYFLRLVPFGILLVIFYILFSKTVVGMWFDIIRYSFIGSDPNEFSCMLSAFNVFALSNLYFNKSKIYKLISLLILIFTFIIVANLTVSKAGILTFVFTILIFHLILVLTYQRKKYYMHIVLISVIFFFSVYFNLINFTPIMRRFSYTYYPALNIDPIEFITTGRASTWYGGLKAFLRSPIIGNGGSLFAEMEAIENSIGLYKVSHNLYISILVQYGIIGFIIFSLIICHIFRRLWRLAKFLYLNTYALVFSVGLISLLFAGISLNWFQREILWFFIVLNSGSINKFIN